VIRRYIMFIEVEVKEKWQEPEYYISLAEKSMRRMAKDLGNFDIRFSHAIEIKDRGLYSILYELITKIVYGKKIKRKMVRQD